MKRTYLLILFFILGAAIAQAEQRNPGDIWKNDVNGYVVDSETKKPLKEVSITVFNTTRKEKVVLTSEDGSYSIDDLKPGVYKVVFEKSGYRRVYRDKVVVKADEAFQLNMELAEHRDFEIMPSPSQFGGI